MFNPDTELLFPPRLIPELRDLRGAGWQKLVDGVRRKKGVDPDRLALVLLMVKLAGCASCHSDSYKAMRGCTQCATYALKRFRGGDEDLLRHYAKAREEIERYLEFRNR